MKYDLIFDSWIIKNALQAMNFDDWKKQEREKRDIIVTNQFFGRENELVELKAFLNEETVSIFGLYSVPMIGKTTLLHEFLKLVTGIK